VADAERAAGSPESTATRSEPTEFDRDTAVSLLARIASDGHADGAELAADVSPDWRAGRGPHGGYLAAMILRALLLTVDDAARAPRSLTIHYARAPLPGPVTIRTTIERAGRSLSTLSARLEQDGSLVALALAAFSVAWSAPQISELQMPAVAPPDPRRESGKLLFKAAPPFTQHLVLQPRIGVVPFQGASDPMDIGAWIGLAEPRAVDALTLAFLSDAMFSPPFIRMDQPATSPTIDLCFARFHTGRVHEGFFEEDGAIWGADGSLLAQSRQLAILMPLPARS
jgi:acyl-coenzyme A thioesterase PaaI-like protein